jgi:hypothetical protein
VDKSDRTEKIVDACVPRGTTDKLARATCRSEESVNVWRRRRRAGVPGQNKFNPLELVELIQDHAFAHAPAEAHRIHRYFARRYDEHFSYRENKPLSSQQRDERLADVGREYAEAIEAILLLPSDRARKEWEELKRKMEEMVCSKESQKEAPPLKAVGGKT